MTNQAYPTLDGATPSWADINIALAISGNRAGQPSGPLVKMTEIAAIKWSRKVDVGDQRGTSGGRIMKRTTGQGSQEASATFYRPGMRALLKALGRVAPTRGNQIVISGVRYTIDIQHTPPGETEIYHVRIKGCRYLGDDDDMKEGADPDKIEITLNPIEIVNVIDGKEYVLL